jgi:hypothetical protein
VLENGEAVRAGIDVIAETLRQRQTLLV